MRKVSVIIPAYNASGHIGRALNSVFAQTYPEIEVVIVNDGSTDKLKDVLQPLMKEGAIKYIETQNRGVSHAVNTGLKSTTGDYMCVLHADDMFLPEKIEKQILFMERFPECGVSYTNEEYFLDGAEKTIESTYFHFSGDIFYFLKRNNFIHASTAMFKSDILRAESFNERLECHEEWDLFLRLSAKGIKFLYIDEVLSKICFHQKNLSSDSRTMDTTRQMVGKHAKQLWKEFKEKINAHSVSGLSSLTRYAVFKIHAALIGFPNHERFNRKTPKELFKN